MLKKGKDSVCIHTGEIKDEQFGGAVSPIFMASSYPFFEVEQKRYPRNFNTPNQEVVARKVAALESAEEGISFGSGMAAIATSLLAFLKSGDHAIFPNAIYGGAYNFIVKEFPAYGIEYDFTDGLSVADFTAKIKKNTKVIYLETPSNPLLEITDIRAVAALAKKHNLISMIDNTFASPINQTPIELGVDISIHSATKYLGGHSDILAGVAVGRKNHIDLIRQKGINYGGNLSDFMAYLLERSIKTLAVRVKKHNENAQILAEFLEGHKMVDRVYYPGLITHKDHQIAKSQMQGFGGMMSFELNEKMDVIAFQKALKMIKPSMSLAGVESTILMPSLTSHSLLSENDRKKAGIKNNLLRFSVGIENSEDIIQDLEMALSIKS